MWVNELRDAGVGGVVQCASVPAYRAVGGVIGMGEGNEHNEWCTLVITLHVVDMVPVVVWWG